MSQFAPKSRQRYSLALSTWLCAPSLGMTEFQVMMRSSAFIIKSSLDKEPHYHVVTASHNVAPWKYPKYYPEEFMRYINEDHVYFTVELRNADSGEMIVAGDLCPYSYHHKDKDLAILHMQVEMESLNKLKPFGFEMLDIEDYQPNDGEELIFHGHEVYDRSAAGLSDEDTIKLSAPRTVKGSLLGRSDYQTFCRTPEVHLWQGMCGGPIVGVRGSICGMVEGIVPTDHPSDELRGAVSMIEANDILKFVKDVEEGSDDVVQLVGGSSSEHVGEESMKTEKDELVKDPMEFLMKRL